MKRLIKMQKLTNKRKKKRKINSGMDFINEELAQARIDELKAYNRPAYRKGKRVYEIIGWNNAGYK